MFDCAIFAAAAAEAVTVNGQLWEEMNLLSNEKKSYMCTINLVGDCVVYVESIS